MNDINNIVIGGERKITIKDAVSVAREFASVQLDSGAPSKMEQSRQLLVDQVAKRTPVYGINTQFGSQVTLLDKNLRADEFTYKNSLKNRQHRLVISHNIGVGPEAPSEAVRATMLLRAHCLGQGISGVRPATVQALLNFLNKRLHPVVRQYGSIGASGDLIPLAGIAAALIGSETSVYVDGQKMSAPNALQRLGLEPLTLDTREGLALINGTSFMTGITALAYHDLQRVYRQMMKAIALNLEAMLVIDTPYYPFVHKVKHHPGQIAVNELMRSFWKGSKLVRSLENLREQELHKFQIGNYEPAKKLQDYYSLRSVAQGFGPMHENMEQAKLWIEREMNSVNDNPVIDVQEQQILHTANFMGYYIVEACDILKMDIAQASSWLHALLANLVHPAKNHGLPTNVIKNPDIDNGFRPVQLLAAAITVQNRKFAQSHQAFMIPTEGDNQDVNSLGTHAAFDLRESVANLQRLVAIMLWAGAQAIELRGVEHAGEQAQNIHKHIRAVSPFIEEDRAFLQDLNAIEKLMREDIF